MNRTPGYLTGPPAFTLLLVLVVGCIGGTLVIADTPAEIAASSVQKGDDLMMKGNFHEALSAYEAAVNSDPFNSLAWNKLGVAHMKTGRYGDAVIAFEKSLAIDPFYSTAWNNKGDAFYYLGNYEEAIAAYDRALGINANDLYALVHKGISLQEAGNSSQAMRVYEEVILRADREVRKRPNDARYDAKLWTNKGDALYQLGRYEEALSSYQTALSINPKFEGAISGKSRTEENLILARSTNGGDLPDGRSSPVPTGSLPVPVSVGSILCGVGLAAALNMVRKWR